jgi:hypothetical protein
LIAGVISTIVVGLVWPKIFPAIIMLDHYYGAGPSLPIIIGLVAIYSSPAAVFGGMIGGWIPKEGNGSDETILAAIFAVLLSVPLICYGLWFFTGW